MAFRLRYVIGSAVFTAGLAAMIPFGQAQAAEPANPCTGPSPVAGVEIRGPVLHVIDGETLCVALGFQADEWVKLRLADATDSSPVMKTSTAVNPPNARGVLMQVALAKMATCRTQADEAGRVVAVCEVEGRPIGEQLRKPEVIAAGYEWR